MKRTYIILVMAIILAVAALAVIFPQIERGLASQSETDSTDELLPGTYIKATSSDGGPVSIPSVTYVQSSDKEYYQIADINRSSSGNLRVKTPNDDSMGMRVIVNFQNQGSWMFIDSIDLTLRNQAGYIVLVEYETILTGTTVLWMDDSGIVQWDQGVTDADGKRDVTKPSSFTSYKVWGTGNEITTDYSFTSSDANNGFVVLVKAGTKIEGYNIIKIYKDSTKSPQVNKGRSVGYVVPDMDNNSYKKWRVWYSSTVVTGYKVNASDAFDKSGVQSTYNIYNAVGVTGVSGNPSDNITVKTGYYDYSIDVQYKSKIKINPTAYHGENMVSNVVFLLADEDPLGGNSVGFDPNGGSLAIRSKIVYPGADIKAYEYDSTAITLPTGDWYVWSDKSSESNKRTGSYEWSDGNEKSNLVLLVNSAFPLDAFSTAENATFTLVKIGPDGTGTAVPSLIATADFKLTGDWKVWGGRDLTSRTYELEPNDRILGTNVVVLVSKNYNPTGKTVVTVDKEHTLGTLPEPVRDGYTFAGWYTTADLDPSHLVTSASTVTPANLPADRTTNTYFAKWEVHIFWMVLDESSSYYVCGEEDEYPISQLGGDPSYDKLTPTRTCSEEGYCYEFDGWSLTIGGDVLTTLPKVSKNAIYYAHFTKRVIQS